MALPLGNAPSGMGEVHGEDEGEARKRVLGECEQELLNPPPETPVEAAQIQQAEAMLDAVRQLTSPGAGRGGRRGVRHEAVRAGYEDGRDDAIQDSQRGITYRDDKAWLQVYDGWLDHEHYFAAIKPKKDFSPRRYKKGWEKGYETYRGHKPASSTDIRAFLENMTSQMDRSFGGP